MTIKDLVYKILLENPETRDSRKLLYWEVLKNKGYVHRHESGNEYIFMPKELFMSLNPESVRRCSQDLQNLDSKDKYYSCEDKLLIQPSKKIKQMRDELAKQKGKSYIQGKQPVYNPEKGVYEI